MVVIAEWLRGTVIRPCSHAAAEDNDAEALIKRVEDAHARRNVARTMMLYKMRKVLTVEQRHWFDSRSQAYGR